MMTDSTGHSRHSRHFTLWSRSQRFYDRRRDAKKAPPRPPPTTPVATDTYATTPGKNRLASITTSAGLRSITYDARGNTLSETRPASKTVAATYDGYGRLLAYNRTGDLAQTNVYNGVDDRVSVTSGSTTRKYLYDGDGRLLGEYGASATAPVAETIWMSPEVANDNQPIGGDDGVGGYAPLAVAVGSGSGLAMQWVHGNHLGVPLVTTNASGVAIVPTGYTMPGFPGQTRTLSDIYYNRYRDYDSSTGRYIQADPIGIEGDANSYLYALGNPLKYTDPSGEVANWIIGGVGGALIGSGGNLIWQLSQNGWRLGCVDPWQVGKWAAIGAVTGATLGASGPRGILFGRARYRNGSSGFFNQGSKRIGWSWNQNGYAGARNYFGPHGGEPGSPTHWHRQPIPGPKGPGW